MRADAEATSSWFTVVVAVARRPGLWRTAVRQALRFRRRGWWRKPPFMPVPDPGLLRFRLVTAYGGDGSGRPQAQDVIAWLDWCRQEHQRSEAVSHHGLGGFGSSD